MGKRFMANLHASLDSICKSRISKISTRCQNWGIHSTTFEPELRNEFKNFAIFRGSIPQLLIWTQKWIQKFCNLLGCPFHNFWSWTQKWIQNFSNLGVSIPQLLILNSEMNLKIFQILEGSIPKLLTLNSEIKVWHWYLLWGFLQYQVHYRHFKSAFSIEKIVN